MEAAETRFRFALWFRVDGDMGYLSHRDTLTFWQRAIARAQLPVKFSRGFNPHMRLSLPLPRSVGMVSDQELLVAEMVRYVCPVDIEESLSGQMPDGIRINQVEDVPCGVAMNPLWVDYRLQLTDCGDLGRLQDQLNDFQESEHCCVDRPARGRHPRRQLDFRQQVDSLKLEGSELCFRVQIDLTGTVRVNELCGYLSLSLPEHIHEIRRLAVGYPEYRVVHA